MKLQGNRGCFNTRCMVHGTGGRVKCIFLTVYRVPCTVYLFILYLFTFHPCTLFSQDTPVSLTYKSTMLGYGTSSVYDSYLSPLNYTGNNVGLFYEQMKNTGLMNGNISAQHIFSADYSWTNNKPGTASYYTGLVEYNYGLLYRFKPAEKWKFFVGPQAGGLLGFVYNTRNSNNPATGKANVDLSLSGIANYKLQIRSQPVYLRYQLSIPFVGAMYSPQYGESYYEISLGDTKNLVHLSSFYNYLSIGNMLTAEIPFNRFTLRLSYHFSIYETRINNLDTRLITNTFYIGFSSNFYTVTGKQKKNNYRYVFE